MTTFATSDGTKKYAARFAATRAPRDISASSRGCGFPRSASARIWESPTRAPIRLTRMRLSPPSNPARTSSIPRSITGSSARNARWARRSRSLRGAASRGKNCCICTKGGFLTPDGDMPADASEYFNHEYVATDILREGDVAAGCHSMAPRFIADQLERSRRNLGVETIDVYYLHNPETQLGEVPREMFNSRVRAAFEFLESAVAAAKIHFYGMATWNAFRQGENEQDFLSLAAMESLARDVAGGSHHFRFVQLPCNLGMTEALTRSNQTARRSAACRWSKPQTSSASRWWPARRCCRASYRAACRRS